MSVRLEDYAACLKEASVEVRDVLDGSYAEAARVMSPAGLERYLEGAKGLCALGRGTDLVVTFLQQMPRVAKECGDDVITDCVHAALKLSSMTSGSVIALLFASLPTAARRLGDPELLRGYLGLVHQLSARAARGLRSMFDNIDELLGKLTLSGLRRWAFFGAEAYKRDLDGLVGYFSLRTPDSRAMLDAERRGTLFVDAQRKLNFYLRAMWGRDFFMRPAAADHEGFRPYVEQHVLHLPDALDDLGPVPARDLYRAQAAHLAAHIAYTTRRPSAEQLSPAQMFFVGLFEDARVEHNAIRALPGSRKLWAQLFEIEHGPAPHPTVAALERVAHALLDPSVRPEDEAAAAIVDTFHAEIDAHLLDPGLSWTLGVRLFNVYAGRREVPSLRLLEAHRIPYRDDNRFVWATEEPLWAEAESYIPRSLRQIRRTVSLMAMMEELDCELAGDDAREIWRLDGEFYLDQEGCTINELEGKAPASEPFHYREWDYQVQLFRPDWATVYERRPPRGDPSLVDTILTENRPITQKIRRIIDKLQPQGVQRVRNLEDGDEIDLGAAVDAMIAIRSGRQPDPRITMRNVITSRDLAVLLLLDLSESTNEAVQGSDKTVLDLTRDSAALVSTAIEGIGDSFAVHGFASDGRHDVQYYELKGFEQRFGDEAKSRLAGMQGGLSTRMGAAMRHAARHLAQQPERRKLLLLVTDGEPADIDERDPQYLRNDAKKAVEELHTAGVLTYCLTLDPRADQYVQRIFGANRYTIVDHVDRLPEKLPALFASLTS